jgi:hypothetical protein
MRLRYRDARAFAGETQSARSVFFGLVMLCLTSLHPLAAQWQSKDGTIYYNGGNVGVGTPSPSEMLHLYGSYFNPELLIQNSGSYPASLQFITTQGNALVGLGIYSGPGFTSNLQINAYPGQVNLNPGGGAVGIGTPNAGASLDVERDANDGGSILRVGTAGGYHFDFARSQNNGALSIQGNQTGYNNIVLAPTGGNVGIGTTNPASYKLAVEGTIGAREVVVTTSTWSDYVFKPGYRLTPLPEVARYIQLHQHLPEIPSEEEVKKKGISVGEMQAKLLAKVEELTVHMIQADEHNRRLEEQNRELQDRIARLEATEQRKGGAQ